MDFRGQRFDSRVDRFLNVQRNTCVFKPLYKMLDIFRWGGGGGKCERKIGENVRENMRGKTIRYKTRLI